MTVRSCDDGSVTRSDEISWLRRSRPCSHADSTRIWPDVAVTRSGVMPQARAVSRKPAPWAFKPPSPASAKATRTAVSVSQQKDRRMLPQIVGDATGRAPQRSGPKKRGHVHEHDRRLEPPNQR